MYRIASLLHIETARLTRRQGLGLLAAGLGAPSAWPQAAPAAQVWWPVAPDVWVAPGVNAEAAAANQGQVANTAVLRSGSQALLVDPGPHWRRGQALRQSLQAELGLQVSAVVNTHAHPENVLGNAAFADLPIYASATTRQLMQNRCENCRANLTQLLGESLMQGTAIVLPQHDLVDAQQWSWAQRELQVAVFAKAHTPGDLALLDRANGVLLAGGLAYRERIPEMQESSVLGWLAALDRLQSWAPRYVIGQGQGLPAQTLQATRGYLATLAQLVQQAIERGDPETAATPQLALPAWANWAHYPQRHALNVQHVWAELEALWWQGQSPSNLVR